MFAAVRVTDGTDATEETGRSVFVPGNCEIDLGLLEAGDEVETFCEEEYKDWYVSLILANNLN